MLLDPVIDSRLILLLALVAVRAACLSAFLPRCIHKAGKDARFNEIKPSLVLWPKPLITRPKTERHPSR